MNYIILFLKLKKIELSAILILGVASFYGINFYENKNDCILQFATKFPFLICEEQDFIFPYIDDPQNRVSHPTLKPLILLYPQKDINVDVNLTYIWGFSATFPEYNTVKKGWSILAHSDGTLKDFGTNQDTYGLFWEGYPVNSSLFDLSKGYIVRGSDIRDFLYSKLTEIGLNTKEKSDFIMFWYPKLQDYPYVQITFAGEDYANIAKLDINPKPDSLLRVFMLAKPLAEYKEIPEQKLQKFDRKGFSVVEWGGKIIE